MASDRELMKRVAGTEMAFYIDRKAGPQRAGVLSSLGLVAKSFRLLPRKGKRATANGPHRLGEGTQGMDLHYVAAARARNPPAAALALDRPACDAAAHAPQTDQKQVWFVIDELASLQKLPQLHTAITENRKSKNPLVLGFQGKGQLEVIYGHLAEVMLSQPATKIFMKTAEPKAAEWISEAIGKVEIERLQETKFDGSRSGKNFTLDRQIEPLVMGSEITGLDDRHAYLKLGNNVARFDFDYLDLPTPTPGFVPRNCADDELQFDRETLEPKRPQAEWQPRRRKRTGPTRAWLAIQTRTMRQTTVTAKNSTTSRLCQSRTPKPTPPNSFLERRTCSPSRSPSVQRRRRATTSWSSRPRRRTTTSRATR